MNRRDILHSLFFGSRTANSNINRVEPGKKAKEKLQPDTANSFRSKWHLLPGSVTVAEDFRAQDFTDWCIKNGALNCLTHGLDRTMQLFTHQLIPANKSFRANLIFCFLNQAAADCDRQNFAGFRFGVRGGFENHCSKMINEGIDVGVTRNGYLFIGETVGDRKVDEKILIEKISLQFSIIAQSTGGNFAKLKALDKWGNTISTLNSSEYGAAAWQGNIELISNCKANKGDINRSTIAMAKFEIEGEKITFKIKSPEMLS